MNVFFYVFNSGGRNNREFLAAASIPEAKCIYGGEFRSGTFGDTTFASEIRVSRKRDPRAIILAVVHPQPKLAPEVISWKKSLEDLRLVVALCSAGPSEIRVPPQDGVVVLGEPLPELADDDFSKFHGALHGLCELLTKIERSNPDQCANIAKLYADSCRSKARRAFFFSALDKVLAIGDEQLARRRVTEFGDYYEGAERFLDDARYFDRESGLTWMGKLSNFHHADLAPRFCDPSNIFKDDPAIALAQWRLAELELLRLLDQSFPFSLLGFARAAKGHAQATNEIFGEADEIRGFLKEMRAALDSEGSDTLTTLSLGVRNLSAKLSEMKGKWYCLR